MIPLSLPCDALSSLVWFIVRLEEKQHVASRCRLDTFAALRNSLSYISAAIVLSVAPLRAENSPMRCGWKAAMLQQQNQFNQSTTRQSKNTFICLKILINK